MGKKEYEGTGKGRTGERGKRKKYIGKERRWRKKGERKWREKKGKKERER